MKKIKLIIVHFLIVSLIGAANQVSAHSIDQDKQQIRTLINSAYDSPEHKVVIDPIVVKGEHALASWVQQAKGGRAVLARTKNGSWEILLCSGKEVKEPTFLVKTGIPPKDAASLTRELAAAEAPLSKEKISLFDSFNGIVHGAHHPGQHAQH